LRTLLIYNQGILWESKTSGKIIKPRKYMKIKSKHFGWCENRGYIAEIEPCPKRVFGSRSPGKWSSKRRGRAILSVSGSQIVPHNHHSDASGQADQNCFFSPYAYILVGVVAGGIWPCILRKLKPEEGSYVSSLPQSGPPSKDKCSIATYLQT